MNETDSATYARSSHHRRVVSSKDGRIKNAVPNALKGRTDSRNGNFGVMLMEIGTTEEALLRENNAKATSESTARAARIAFQDGYVPLSRLKVSPETIAPTTQRAVEEPLVRASSGDTLHTKAEQARLLGLLQSLQPKVIVDQLCGALAFFGGACPGADTCFPESSRSNGSGSLLVNWLAEIFPSPGTVPEAFRPPVYQAPLPTSLSLSSTDTRRPRNIRHRGAETTKSQEHRDLISGMAAPTQPNNQYVRVPPTDD